jgi:hypothetical protein
MSTPYGKVFDQLLASIEEDDWARVITEGDMEILHQDLIMILNNAAENFLFPRIDIDDRDDDEMEFANDLTFGEIYVLAVLMKHEWIKRCVASWKVIKQQYHDNDFQKNSEANHLDKLMSLQKLGKGECKTAQNNYARKKYNYRSLTGGRITSTGEVVELTPLLIDDINEL